MTHRDVAHAPGRRIRVVGAFDMDNYGDLLFPLVARYRLSPFGFDVAAVAPSAAGPAIPDALETGDIASLIRGEADCDGLIIGGGYIIHTHPMDVLSRYSLGESGDWAAAGLWLGATLAAGLSDIPVVWNAPGVLYPFVARQWAVVEACLAASDYVSVRDEGSAGLLPRAAAGIHVVPDPIADLARMWPQATLAADFAGFLERKGVADRPRLLALHLRARSLSGMSMEALAVEIDGFAQGRGVMPVLMAVGRSHDDDGIAAELASRLRVPHLVYSDPRNLREMTAVLAHAALYVGASLHGYIAAAAYGVPGVLVARPAYHKFAGFLAHTGRDGDLVREWSAAFTLAARRAEENRAVRIPPRVLDALDEHWQRIRDGLADPAHRRRERQAFLATLLRGGLAAGGPAWALRPFLSGTARHRLGLRPMPTANKGAE